MGTNWFSKKTGTVSILILLQKKDVDLMDIPRSSERPQETAIKSPCERFDGKARAMPYLYTQKPLTAFLTALRAISTSPTTSNSPSHYFFNFFFQEKLSVAKERSEPKAK